MINFFRKTRQSLLNEGKTARYFKYAVGEILLVVIGILIALQINNWNEARKEFSHELKIISGLHTEIVRNIEFTDILLEKNNQRLIAIKELLNISTEELKVLSDEQLNAKILQSAITSNYSPLVSKLNRLLGMEDLQSKKANSLIGLLYFYRNSIHDVSIQYDTELATFINKQIPLFNKNISVKNIMHQRAPKEISKSKNTVDIKSFIKSLEFENLYSDLYATGIQNTQLLNKNIELMHQIIRFIEENYPVVVNIHNST